MNEIESLLIKKSKVGDIESFERLIESYQKRAYNIALRIMCNEEDAKDMAQEAFIRIYKSIKDFKEQSSFSTWLYRIVTNVCLDEMRRKKKIKTETIDTNYDEASCDKGTPENVYEINEKRQQIMKAINELNEDYKTVIILRDIQGFSYEEISNILDCSIGTVKSRINRGRNILKDKLSIMLELTNKKSV